MAVTYHLLDSEGKDVWIGQRGAETDWKTLRVYTAEEEVEKLREFLERNNGKYVLVEVI